MREQSRRATVRDVRRANRSSLLTDLFHGGRQSRQELGESTALSPATVSNLIAEMVDEGLVEEAGLVGSDGGRPRALLRVAPGYGCVAGADVSEDRVLVELYDLAMSRLAVARYAVEGPDPQVAVARLREGLEAVVAEAGVARSTLLGFGVGVPGVVDRSSGSPVVYPQATGWGAVPSGERATGSGAASSGERAADRDAVPLGERLGDGTGVPVFVENGAKAVGQAEMWFGAGRGARHAVVVTLGAGVGAAVVVEGRGDGGAFSGAGEWGHTTLVYDGEVCRCGARGCLEAYLGSARVLARLAAATGHPPEPRLLTRMLAAEEAAEAVARTVGYLGAGIAGLVNLFSPERIVLGGPTGLALGERFLPEIRAAAARNALRQPYSRTRIELCQLGPDAVAMGAATLPIARLLDDGGLPPSSRRGRS